MSKWGRMGTAYHASLFGETNTSFAAKEVVESDDSVLDLVLKKIRSGTIPELAMEQLVPHENRKMFGQFFTPDPIARAMVDWILEANPETLLDPAVGPGIFIDHWSRSENTSIRKCLAIDIDPLAIEIAKHRISDPKSGLVSYMRDDFLASTFEHDYDAIVCNPPYVRHHDANLPDEVFRQFQAHFGLRFSRLTNIYCLFLLKIMTLLSSKGRAAVITPTEFLNADFGQAIKTLLLESQEFCGFIVIDFQNSVFENVLSTATITLFDSRCPSDDVTLVKVRDLTHLESAFTCFSDKTDAAQRLSGFSITNTPRASLNPSSKWSTSSQHLVASNHNHKLKPFSTYCRCNRGIATGANKFFTLSEAERKRWNLDKTYLKPCITKANHARFPRFDHDDLLRLRESDKRVWVLDVASVDSPELSRYLEYGKSLSIHKRYLPRHRKPWYSTEKREPADMWVTVFGRRNLRFIQNIAAIRNLTSFHAIYLHPQYKRYMSYLIAYFYSSEIDEVSALQHRVYGGGLLKFEPKDVERLLMPDLDTISDDDFSEGTSLGMEVLRCQDCCLAPELQDRLDKFFCTYSQGILKP